MEQFCCHSDNIVSKWCHGLADHYYMILWIEKSECWYIIRPKYQDDNMWYGQELNMVDYESHLLYDIYY